MNEAPELTGSEVAVVGMAIRAPGAPTIDAFWENLRQGVESVRHFTADELVKAGEDPEIIADPDYVRARPALENIDRFDAEFFGLSPQDAAITDPQHRIFLEIGWEALEHAGHDPSRFNGQVGVFATCGMNSYMMYHLVTNPRLMRTVGEWLIRHTGNDMSFLATSLSYRFDLKGPSLNVQCACSSALVAIHLATQSLLAGECDMALAGGSVITFPQDRGYLYQAGEILARDGHCRPFDANATGTLFGSGAGIVVLRRLSDAMSQGDNILAVIKGSAANNDGAMKVGFLAPSVEGQSRVITEALAVSGVDAGSISYVEAHGTGTIVGDPIEVTALTEAYRRHTQKTGFCRIGSLKSNIGHLGEAAGALGFIKTVLSLQHRQLPASLNYESPNPRVDFAASPFVVNDRLCEWTSPNAPRRAGVTALGAGGTNCHVILEEAPASARAERARAEQLLVLSAETPTALTTMRSRLADALERTPSNLADAAHTLQVGRSELRYRWSGVATSAPEAVSLLRNGGGTPQEARPRSNPTPVVFLFPGGGAQYPNMARGIYESDASFRRHVDHCLDTLHGRHRIDLRPLLFPAPGSEDTAAKELARPILSILSIFVVEYALAQLWLLWGIEPAAMSGHSLGEYAAACVAGVFSVEDALSIVKARGDVFERLPRGAMTSVLLPEAEIAPRLSGRLALAAVNATSTCVVSGPVDDVGALEASLGADGIETQRLRIDVAAHSPMLDPFLDGFRREVETMHLSAPTRRVVSNLTGRWMTATEATNPDYWVRHLRNTVRFSDGLGTLLADPDQILLEVGPGRALTSFARLQAGKPAGLVTSMPHPSEDVGDVTTLLNAAGRLWSLGARPNWQAVNGGRRGLRIALPTYPFERQRHWVDREPATSQAGRPAPTAATSGSTERQADMADWFVVPVWATAPLPDEVQLAGDVLVFADATGFSEEVVSQIARLPDSRTFTVTRGSSFAQLTPESFAARPSDADDIAALLEAVSPRIDRLTHVVYAWTLQESPSQAGLAPTLDRAFFGPLALAQALGRADAGQLLTIAFLTNGAVQIAGEAAANPVAATTLGPSRVLPRELATVSTRVLDVHLPSGPRRAVLAGLVAREIGAPTSAPVVAYRGSTRWVESLAHRRLSAGHPSSLREGGVYLITGGLGAIGLALARHLAETHHATVVLVGRAGLPPPEGWDRWTREHAADDATTERITAVRACEAAGGTVLVVAADVTDETALRRVRNDVRRRFGALHGIFHAAGALDDGLMQMKTPDSALAVLRPKVQGTLSLDAVFGGDALDVFVLFSSISSVLGLQGQADYTAANAFLDAFAVSAAERLPVVSINWGPWRDIGLAVTAAAHRHTGGTRLPAYPWFESSRSAGAETTFTLTLARDRQWMIGEHVVHGGEAVLPGTSYVELARAALAETGLTGAVEIRNLLFQAPIVVPLAETVTVDLVLHAVDGVHHAAWRGSDQTYATAELAASTDAASPTLDLAAVRQRCQRHVVEPGGPLDQPFMDFGPRWSSIERIGYGSGEALIELALPQRFATDLSTYLLHPALLDMATGGAQALIPGFDQAAHFYVPFSYGRLRMLQPLSAEICSHIRLTSGTVQEVAVFDITISDRAGRALVDIEGFCMTRVAFDTALARSRVSSGSGVAARSQPAASPAAAIASDLLQQGLSIEEGFQALARVLAQPAPVVAISPGDLVAWQTRIERAFPRATTASAPRHPSPPASSGGVEADLKALWAALLGVPDVDDDDDFFELGGHSLIAVRLLNHVEKRLGRRLPLSALFEARTVAKLARLLGGGEPDTARPFASLVAIQPGGTQPPLYAVHAVGGEVLSYSELARQLGPDQPFYAFQSVGQDGTCPIPETIDAQAALYISELLRHRPDGPYYLTGWSHGGRVAFEMARQLTQAGHDVAFVGVIDVWPTERFPKDGTYVKNWLINLPKWFMADFRYSGVAGNADRLARLFRILRRKSLVLLSPRRETHGRAELDDLMRVPDHLRHAGEVNLNAFLTYQPRPYDGTVTLLRAYAQPLASPHSPDLGWGAFARNIDVLPVSGNHGSLMTLPDVRDVALKLKLALTSIQRSPGVPYGDDANGDLKLATNDTTDQPYRPA